ncbi:hypothetical protein Glove_69g64 [Diversispora epigaea]|uniref:Uncharacterized protein n=1 Tax=Diversispora epigaea TaxID=1348612 RepID=A0A397JA46_9GLOM|nr:hypothetical protein Glove_69g64 [Diversispora epigaea]
MVVVEVDMPDDPYFHGLNNFSIGQTLKKLLIQGLILGTAEILTCGDENIRDKITDQDHVPDPRELSLY